jgi:hypothetical protein
MRWVGFGVGTAVAAVLSMQQAYAASPLVRAAESSVYLDLGAADTQYHEDLSPSDEESGLTGAARLGVSVLETLPSLHGLDFYAALESAAQVGTLNYTGQTEYFNGSSFAYAPYKTTDNAVFDRVEGRAGLGIPMGGGAESIPFLEAGYQIWSRNDKFDGGTQTENYHAALVGGGYKLDIPAGRLVLSATAEVDAIVAAGVTLQNFYGNNQNQDLGLGISPEERLELAADDALTQHFHLRFSTFVEHFTYVASKEQFIDYYGYPIYLQEPSSRTTQYGATVGFGFSF